jgi:hypothetical protein
LVLLTVPLPVPTLLTVRAKVGVNVAVTDVAALKVTVQVVAVPVQAPLQPLKVEPAAGAAARVTCVPLVYEAEHVLPQLIPVTLVLLTVPLPLPLLVMVSV